ncbi:hypothetical protein AB0M79_31090 [Polymorphospora sp. NPDC051019]|uniref:uridine kinase family protein n=1 Tax=Polymorphospora sp. NPDC051019 TaxID=3155725 RepID=UPI00341E73B0
MTRTLESYAELAARVLAGPPLVGRSRLVAVDGPSGAGKTRFAGRLAAALEEAATTPAGPARTNLAAGPARTNLAADPARPDVAAGRAGRSTPTGGAGGRVATVVHTDDLLDGWDDQLTFWDRLEESVLGPLRAGRPGTHHRYDWLRAEFGPDPVVVDPAPVVVLEGFSAARAAVRPELSLAVFVVAPADLRLDRALSRDGAALRPHLERWRRTEDVHFRADRTADHADLVVDGAPAVPHDTRHYVRIGGARWPA